MQGIFKRTAITDTVVMKRLLQILCDYRENKQSSLPWAKAARKLRAGFLWINRENFISEIMFFTFEMQTSSLKYLQMLRFELKMFYLPFNHPVVGGAPCTGLPLLSPHLVWGTPSPPHALGTLTAHLSHTPGTIIDFYLSSSMHHECLKGKKIISLLLVFPVFR